MLTSDAIYKSTDQLITALDRKTQVKRFFENLGKAFYLIKKKIFYRKNVNTSVFEEYHYPYFPHIFKTEASLSTYLCLMAIISFRISRLLLNTKCLNVPFLTGFHPNKSHLHQWPSKFYKTYVFCTQMKPFCYSKLTTFPQN